MEARSQLRHRPTIGNILANQSKRNGTFIFAHPHWIVNVLRTINASARAAAGIFRGQDSTGLSFVPVRDRFSSALAPALDEQVKNRNEEKIEDGRHYHPAEDGCAD